MAYRTEHENRALRIAVDSNVNARDHARHLRSPSKFEPSCADSTLADQIVHDSLWEPLEELRQRPSKHFRAQLIALGWRAWRGEETLAPETSRSLEDFIEDLHLGSLIVDDVQDHSLVRRGGPCLHRLIGTPLAINAGNALYFKAFQRLEQAQIAPAIELGIHRQAHATLIEAHEGQALDLSLRAQDLSAEQVQELCPKVSRLKTGALMALAVEVGARAAGATNLHQLESLRSIVSELGVTLQRFDDLGNLLPHFAGEKAFEDVGAGRLCWPWAFAAETGQLDRLNSCVAKLPEPGPLQNFVFETNFVFNAASRAFDLWQDSLAEYIENQASAPDHEKIPYAYQLCRELQDLAQKVSCSYGFKSLSNITT